MVLLRSLSIEATKAQTPETMKISSRFLLLGLSALSVLANTNSATGTPTSTVQSILANIYLNLGAYIDQALHWYKEGQNNGGLATTSGVDFVFAVAPPLRINCGGAAFVDTEGIEWSADTYFKGGFWRASRSFATGGLNFALFQTYRTEVSGPLQYDLPLTKSKPGENYVVSLYFGDKVGFEMDFSVSVDEVITHTAQTLGALEDSSPYKVVRSTVVGTGGLLSIRLDPGTSDRVWLSAIEVVAAPMTQAPAPTPPPVDTIQAPSSSISRPPTNKIENPFGFEPILINVGGSEYSDVSNVTWLADQYFDGGTIYEDGSQDVAGTQDDILYQTERVGAFSYSIPLPVGTYTVSLHFAEVFFTEPGQRLFDIWAEDLPLYTNVDNVEYAGSNWTATTLSSVHVISDGSLDLSFVQTDPAVDNPKLSAIEIELLEPHLAHAVSGGPYRVVDIDGTNAETVLADGSQSHTHAVNENLVEFVWKSGAEVVGLGEIAELTLPVGEHDISLTVVDSAGNSHTEDSTVTVLPSNYPALAGISPEQGPIAGGMKVVLKGSGFGSSQGNISVKFGLQEIESDQISLVDSNTIEVIAPSAIIGAPAPVSVVTNVSYPCSGRRVASVLCP